jgi:hypothetical protein
MSVLHAFVATAPIPLLLIVLVKQHRLLAGWFVFVVFGIAAALFIAIALTLVSRLRLRMLRFVTLIPMVLSVAAVLRVGATSIDQKLSARPLAMELASVETHKLPLAVYGVPRELEFGLTFYRNQPIARYEAGTVPGQEHLLVAPATWKVNVAERLTGRRATFLGHYAPQNVDYYWVAAATTKP